MSAKRLFMIFVIFFGLVLVWAGLFRRDSLPSFPATHADKPQTDFSQHPVYRSYSFGAGPAVIDVGIQPLWLPPGIITEAMRRDQVLRRALKKMGKEIRFHAFLKGADVNHFLGQGQLEVGIGGDMPALSAIAHHKAVVGAMVQQGFCSIVAREHMTVRDLAGRRVGIAYGSNAHYALMNALAGEAVPVTAIQPVFVDVNEMPKALADSRIDAYSAWEPTPTVSTVSYPEHRVIHRSLTTGYLYFCEGFFAEEKGAAQQVILATLRALHWLHEDKANRMRACDWAMAAGRVLSGEQTVLKAEDYMKLVDEDLLERHSAGMVPATDLVFGGRLAQEFSFLKQLGKVPESISWQEVQGAFAVDLIRDILPGPERSAISITDYRGDSHEQVE